MHRINRRVLGLLAVTYVANFHTSSHAAASQAETAVDRLRSYFSALSARRYTQAFSIWETRDGTRSTNGQTRNSFAAGFKNTRQITASIGVPADAEGAAGSVFVEIPVTIEALLTNGRKQVFQGTYVMRSSNMADDHDWYIYKATMKQVH